MISVRALTKADISEDFVKVLNDLAETKFDYDELCKVYDLRSKFGIRTYIAVRDSELVGTISAIMEPKFIHGGSIVCHIEDVVVKKDTQGSGVGKLMMDYIEQMAKAMGCYKIILDCSDDNIPFYEKCGFKRYENCMRRDCI